MSLYLGNTEIKGITTGDAAVTIIEKGVELPTLSNPASANEIGEGYEAIDEGGKVISGTAELASSLADELTTQNNLISQITTALEGKVVPNGDEEVKTCTVTFEETSGYDAYIFFTSPTPDAGTMFTVIKSSSHTAEVVCGTAIGIYYTCPITPSSGGVYSATGMYDDGNTNSDTWYCMEYAVFIAPADQDSTASIDIYEG